LPPQKDCPLSQNLTPFRDGEWGWLGLGSFRESCGVAYKAAARESIVRHFQGENLSRI
jgi:hypothetical protein